MNSTLPSLGSQILFPYLPIPAHHTRDRSWEKQNPSRSYIIPHRLREAARSLREEVLSIAQFDENGTAREDLTTVNGVASILMDWVLARAESDPSLLNLTPNPHGRGHFTIVLEESYTPDTSLIVLPAPDRNRDARDANEKDLVLTYRWTIEGIDERIRRLAGKGMARSPKKGNPFTHAVPLGVVVLRLLELAISDYTHRRFRLKTKQVSISQMASSWES